MSLPAALFRLLLCLTLILNGAGYATAATRMHLTHAATPATAEAAPHVEAAEPCHGAAEEAIATHAHAPSAPVPQTDEDCCGTSALCACDCLQHACASLNVPLMAAAIAPSPSLVSPSQPYRPAPPLANPIRPPIG